MRTAVILTMMAMFIIVLFAVAITNDRHKAATIYKIQAERSVEVNDITRTTDSTFSCDGVEYHDSDYVVIPQ